MFTQYIAFGPPQKAIRKRPLLKHKNGCDAPISKVEHIIHNFKNHILVTWPATNLLILRKWCGFEKPITILLFKTWPTNHFSKAKSLITFIFIKTMSHDLLVQMAHYAGGRCLKFMKNWKIYSRKTSRVLIGSKIRTLTHFVAFEEHYGRQVSRKTIAKSLAEGCTLQFSGFTRGESITIQQKWVNISVFTEQRNISFQNDISLQTMRLGVVCWEKLKNRESQLKAESWAWTSFGVEQQVLNRSFRHVYRLEE